MNQPYPEMEDFVARRGYSPAFIRQVHEKRRKEAAEKLAAERKSAAEIRKAKPPLTVRDRKVLAEKHCEKMDADTLFAMAAPPWVKDIVAEVCAEHGISISLLLGKRKTKAVAMARHDAYYRTRKADGRNRPSLPMMGRWFGREHTAVMHGIARHAETHGLPNLTDYDLQGRYRTVAAYVERTREMEEAR